MDKNDAFNLLDTLGNPVGSLLGTGLSAGLNYLGTVQAQKQQSELMKQQMEFSERMQDKQNAYNDPSAQMARLRAAGINPALGQGSTPVASMASAGAQLPNAPATAQFRVPEGFGQNFASAFQGNTNRIQANAYKGLSESQRYNFDLNNGILEATFDEKVIEASLKNDTLRKGLQEAQTRIEHMQTEMKSMEENIQINWLNALVDKGWKEAQVQHAFKQMQLYDVQMDDLRNQMGNRDKMTNAECFELYKRVKLEESQINLNDKEAALKEQDAIYRKAINDFFNMYPELIAMPAGVAKACTMLGIPKEFANVYTQEYSRTTGIGPFKRTEKNTDIVTSDGKTVSSTHPESGKVSEVRDKNSKYLRDLLEKGEKVKAPFHQNFVRSILNDSDLSDSEKKQIEYLLRK